MPGVPFPFAGEYAADIDPDYLYFLRHIRPDGDSFTLELPSDGASPPCLVRYEDPGASTDGECVSDPSPGRASTNRPSEEKDSSPEVEAHPPSFLDSIVDIDEDYRIFLEHTRVVDDRLVLEIGDVVVNYPDGAPSGCGGDAREEKGIDSDEPVAIIPKPKYDWVADPPAGRKRKCGGDEGLNASATRTPDAIRMKTSSSKRNEARHSIALESQSVIWPTHINNRPDSDFKRRLMDVLCKPFSRREYFELFDMATIRTPLVRLRQVRNDTKFYPTDELGYAYFDHYPDLADQVTTTSSYSKGLALLRGFFFWLQNSAHEDQFSPWIDHSKDPEVIPLMD